MSLKWRIAIGMAAIAALVAAFGAGVAYVTTASRLHDSLDQSLVDAAARFRGDGGPGRGPDGDGLPGRVPRGSCPPAGSVQPATVAQIVKADGTVVTNCLPGSRTVRIDADALRTAAAGNEREPVTVSAPGQTYRVVAIAHDDGTVLVLGRNLASVDGVLSSLRDRLVLFSIGGVLAAALLGWFLASRLVRPISRLQRATEYIARTGALDTEVPEGGPGEVGDLAASFTTMVGALADSRARQQRLVADASHELRTPLTSLQTNAELLARADRLTADQRTQVSDGIRFEVRELTDLVSELVTLARDPDSDSEPVDDVDLSALAETAIEGARVRTDRPVHLATAGATVVSGRARGLLRAVSNLIDNAIKYGEGPIEVSVDGRTVTVRDHGPGIPASDLPHVFDRFYRSDAARTEAGSGLGLAIVAQVVERHGGTVFARTARDGGAIVGFTLP